jgi:hypothetical protein
MTMPAFLSKGTVGNATYDSCAGTFTAETVLPGTIVSGDIIVLFVGTGISFGGGTIDFFDSISGYTQAATTGTGSGEAAAYYYKVADGTEDGTVVTVTGTFNNILMSGVFQSYVFNNSGTGGYHNVGGTSTGTSATATFSNVVTSEANELAVGLLFTKVDTNPGNNSGETGGDWTEAAEDDGGGAGTLQCQTAQMASAGTLSGGNTSITSTVWKTFSFALKEIGGATLPPRTQNVKVAVHRAASW